MNYRTCLLAVMILVSVNARAQDKIYKKSGDVIDAKVKTINNTAINYKRAGNPDGPDYMILKKEVSKIVYQNGTIDDFEGGSPGEKGKGHVKGKQAAPKFGNNILSVTPVYTSQLDGFSDFPGINDPGIGISYERLLDMNGHIGFSLPVVLGFASNRDYNNYTVQNGQSYTWVMFMPGVKFYPAPATQRFRYSLGASFFVLMGKEPYAVYTDGFVAGTGVLPSGEWDYTMYGMIISNSLNVTVNKHLFIGFDLGGGIPFSDNRRKDNTFIDNPFPIIQVGMKVGARF